MSRIYMPIGLPGCGKSTYGKMMDNYNLYITSADSIRQELVLGEPYDPKWNPVVFKTQKERIEGAIVYQDKDVYVDNTNIHDFARNAIYYIAEELEVKIHVILFQNIEEAYERNRLRTGSVSGQMAIDEETMNKMFLSLEQNYSKILKEPWTTLTHIDSFRVKQESKAVI